MKSKCRYKIIVIDLPEEKRALFEIHANKMGLTAIVLEWLILRKTEGFEEPEGDLFVKWKVALNPTNGEVDGVHYMLQTTARIP